MDDYSNMGSIILSGFSVRLVHKSSFVEKSVIGRKMVFGS